jgi:cyclohexa-1,5-dienecarbonyl-CoA hydratase
MSAAAGHVRLEAGPVCRITIVRPPLNVLTTALLVELAHALDLAAADAAAKVVLLAGDGRAFCAGVDVAEHTAEHVRGMLDAFEGVIARLQRLEPPVVAAVHGAVLGGGLELALACDIVLAREDAVLGQPEIRLGVFPPAGAALLPRLVGRQRALDLILSGRTLSAGEASAIGLVTHVFATPAFETEVDVYTAGLAGASRPVLRLAKRAVTTGLDRPLADALAAAERIYHHELMPLADPHEGLAAFVAKRPPVWSDR